MATTIKVILLSLPIIKNGLRHKNNKETIDQYPSFIINKILINLIQEHMKTLCHCLTWFQPRDTIMIQYVQISKCNTLYKQTAGHKSHNHLIRCRKDLDTVQHLFMIFKKAPGKLGI